LKTLRFHGYSDDTFGEYGVTEQDHDDAARRTHRAFRVVAGGESLIVVGVYAPKHTPGSWVVGIQLDDVDGDGGGPLPSWPMRFVPSGRPYSPALEIDVPDDVTVTLVARGRDE
jgi:hypothetical protein